MRQSEIKKLSSEELVAKFVGIALRQYEANAVLDTRTYNRLFDQESKFVRELRARPGDHRHMLLDLYQHPNFQVRLNAVRRTFALSREEAERQLREIGATAPSPQGSDARMSLSMLELGISMLPEDPEI